MPVYILSGCILVNLKSNDILGRSFKKLKILTLHLTLYGHFDRESIRIDDQRFYKNIIRQKRGLFCNFMTSKLCKISPGYKLTLHKKSFPDGTMKDNLKLL